MAALERMGAHLRTLKAFQFEAKTTSEEVLDDGQKIQYAGVVNIVAQFPDRLRAKVENNRYSRHFLYNGMSISTAMSTSTGATDTGTLTFIVATTPVNQGVPIILLTYSPGKSKIPAIIEISAKEFKDAES